MRIKEGLIPVAIGSAVTAGAAALRANDIRKRGIQNRNVVPMVETAVLGFGLAHVVLGTIDLIQNKK